MGEAARARIESRYDLRSSVRDTAALFARVIKPAVMKNGVWQPTVVRDKGEGDRRVRLKASTSALEGGSRPSLAAVRSAETS